MTLFNEYPNHPGVILTPSLTAEAAADLTGYNIQYIRRLCYEGRLEATHVGRSWMIKLSSLEAYLDEATADPDNRFGPRTPAQQDDHNDNASP